MGGRQTVIPLLAAAMSLRGQGLSRRQYRRQAVLHTLRKRSDRPAEAFCDPPEAD